jgi:NAD(P)-dependent dehydrogenase (short-subunit alcohol dehydrogenase family)
VKPDLNIVTTNCNGTLYTFKLATYHFRKQKDRGGCFIMTGSMNAWIDSPVGVISPIFCEPSKLTAVQGNWEYGVSKYALRGLMRVVRRNGWEQSIRIVYVAPCYIKSAIRTAEWEAKLLKEGAPFGESDDVAACMGRIATDQSINGKPAAFLTWVVQLNPLILC